MKEFSVDPTKITNLSELTAPINDDEFRLIYNIKKDKELEEIVLPTPVVPPSTTIYYTDDEYSGSDYTDEEYPGQVDTKY